MDLYSTLYGAFNLESKSLKELLELSSRIDYEKANNGMYADSKDELSIIASTIVALLNEPSTFSIGKRIADSLNMLILDKNSEAVESNKQEQKASILNSKKRPGKFRFRKTHSGYVFDLVATNGELLLTSDIYAKPESCLNGIESIKKNSVSHIEDQTNQNCNTLSHPKYELYLDKAGEYRFRLKASNGEIIAVSEGYKNKSSCIGAIERVKSAVNTAEIIKN